MCNADGTGRCLDSCLRFRRLKNELKQAQSQQEDLAREGIRLHDVECPPCDGENVMKITASIDGPANTPYEGGTYQLTFKIPPNYPVCPPKVFFTTQIRNPYVTWYSGTNLFPEENGKVCLFNDVLNDWSGGMSLERLLIDVQSRLSTKKGYNVWAAQARAWAQTYAGAPAPASVDDDSFDPEDEESDSQEAIDQQAFNNLVEELSSQSQNH